MLTETQYRSFDDLLDSVKIDLRTFDLEGMIDSQQLIKVAMRVNYELGLKINPSRSKALEVYKGKAKLPLDFYVLNFALLCEGHNNCELTQNQKTYTQGIKDGIVMAQTSFNGNNNSNMKQFTVTTDIVVGSTIITHMLNTTNIIIQAFAPDNTMLSFNVDISNPNNITIYNESEVTIENVKIVIIGGTSGTGGTGGNCISAELINDCNKSKVITYNTFGKRDEYNLLVSMKMEKSKAVSGDCLNLTSSSPYAAALRNNFLVTNFDEGLVYINYQSLMEDDDGNLLVMDHPLANEYYEYALKQRIYENLFMNGENVANYLQLVEQKLRVARNNALSFINTPDFNEMRKTWEMNRKAQYSLYYDMFKSH